MNKKSKITINSETRISHLINRFNKLFPFLRIEVFRKGEDFDVGQRDFKLFDISIHKLPSSFHFNGESKVIEVETLFEYNLGLKISIFRKMGTSIVETAFTSDWTLNHQNLIGKEIFLTF
jgi:hypothetical protein